MPITLDRSPKGRYPFGVFHTSLGSTLCTESELKSDWTVGDLPSLDRYQSIELQNSKSIGLNSKTQPQKINIQQSEIIVDT